jgi:hypothetical protein
MCTTCSSQHSGVGCVHARAAKEGENYSSSKLHPLGEMRPPHWSRSLDELFSIGIIGDEIKMLILLLDDCGIFILAVVKVHHFL